MGTAGATGTTGTTTPGCGCWTKLPLPSLAHLSTVNITGFPRERESIYFQNFATKLSASESATAKVPTPTTVDIPLVKTPTTTAVPSLIFA